MMQHKEQPLQPLVEGELLAESLAPMTSWHIGGPAERFYRPLTLQDLAHYLQLLPITTPITWLGLGSNVLVRDAGINGAVICSLDLKGLSTPEKGVVIAQAGVPCAKLARYSCKLGFHEAAFFAGIPGTVGGALAMNAGAFGGQTWEWVERVVVMDRQGQVYFRDRDDYEVGYRSVQGRYPEQAQEAFVGAVFRFKDSSETGADKIKELLRKRSQTQPIGTFNCGSVYRNPPGDFAARLIESCQLKGHRIGDAVISEKHANFIINCGKARSQDVESLMSLIESSVYSQFGIELHAEVKIIGQGE